MTTSEPILEILCGMIASGKSSYARMRANDGALVICHDDLTAMLHTKYRYEQELRDCYRRMEESLAWAALNAGRNVVVDRTHLTRESRQRWIEWARNYDSMQVFEGKGPTTRVFASAFPIELPEVHARRRIDGDARGRSYQEWLEVATHHYRQAQLEPLNENEGFISINLFPRWITTDDNQ